MIYLKDTARSPPAGTRIPIGHVEINTSTARTWWIRGRVVGDGALEKNWGRQLGGIGGDGRKELFDAGEGGGSTGGRAVDESRVDADLAIDGLPPNDVTKRS